MSDNRVTYRAEIDGLRAFAVISIIISHFERSLLPSGYLGVDIFFVISGYVITTSLAGSRPGPAKAFLADFYTRRIKRLAPALILFAVVMGIATLVLNPVPQGTFITGIASLFGASNLRLLRISHDYFSESTEWNGFTHTWSLGVEEQFYLVYPACMWLFINRRIFFRRVAYAMIAMSLLSLASFVILYRVNQPAAYFLMPTRLWELGAGAACFFIRNMFGREQVILGSFSTPALAALLVTLFAPLSAGVPATIVAVGLTALIIVTMRPSVIAYTIFTHPLAVQLGLISYSLYLWHWGVLAVSRWTVGIEWWTAPFQAILIYGLAVGSYRFVEKPLRYAVWSQSHGRTIGCGLLASVTTAAFLALLAGPISRSVGLPNLPDHVQHTWWTDVTGKHLEPCHVEHSFKPDYIDRCLGRQDVGKPRIYLIGDSHARNYLPTVRAVFEGVDVRYLTMGFGCALLPVELAARAARVHCAAYVDAMSDFMATRLRHGDVVVVGQKLLDEPERRTPIYLGFVKSFARMVISGGASFILLDGTAPPSKPPTYCVSRFAANQRGCVIARRDVDEAYKDFDRLAAEATREISGFYYAPLRSGLCAATVCGQRTAAGTPVWHDRDHITEDAARELAPLLRAKLERQRFFQK